jgi:hypothetical protein
MSAQRHDSGLQWEHATGLAPKGACHETTPQGALVPDSLHNCDQIAVVYYKGQMPPKITIARVSGSVHTVMADGVAVAVVARASGPAPSVDDVILVERLI